MKAPNLEPKGGSQLACGCTKEHHHSSEKGFALARTSLLTRVFIWMERREAPKRKLSNIVYIHPTRDRALGPKSDGVPSPHTVSEEATLADSICHDCHCCVALTQKLISVVMVSIQHCSIQNIMHHF